MIDNSLIYLAKKLDISAKLMDTGGLIIFFRDGQWSGTCFLLPILFLHPLSEGRGTRLTIRNKNQKNSDCEMSWLVYSKSENSDSAEECFFLGHPVVVVVVVFY